MASDAGTLPTDCLHGLWNGAVSQPWISARMLPNLSLRTTAGMVVQSSAARLSEKGMYGGTRVRVPAGQSQGLLR